MKAHSDKPPARHAKLDISKAADDVFEMFDFDGYGVISREQLEISAFDSLLSARVVRALEGFKQSFNDVDKLTLVDWR